MKHKQEQQHQNQDQPRRHEQERCEHRRGEQRYERAVDQGGQHPLSHHLGVTVARRRTCWYARSGLLLLLLLRVDQPLHSLPARLIQEHDALS